MADAKQKKQLYGLAALLLVAVLVWYSQFAKRSTVNGFALDNKTYTPINAQDFSGVLDQLNKAQSTEYKTSGRNIFVAGAIPASVDPNAPKIVVKPPFRTVGPSMPPPPPPAQLSMIFFGYGNLPAGGPRQAFLLDGDEVRIVSEGDTLQNHIRILHIGNDTIEFEDTNTHQRGTKSMEASTPAA
jgi:hypothetical protein